MNSSRTNRLEELGRVDAEKAYTKTGKANLSDEKARIVREVSRADGGEVKQKWITKKEKPAKKLAGRAGRTGKPAKKTGWITKKQPKTNWITKKEAKEHDTTSARKWLTKKSRDDVRERAAHADGGMVNVSGRGQGKVMSGRKKTTYIC